MKETVILEAPPAEKCVKGVHCLFTWDRFCSWTINIGCAFRWKCIWIQPFCQFNVSAIT